MFKGDLTNAVWFVEVKSTRRQKIQLESLWWIKAKKQAEDKLKTKLAILVGFAERPDHYGGTLDFAVVAFDKSIKIKDKIEIKGRSKSIKNSYLEDLGEAQLELVSSDFHLSLITRKHFISLNADLRT